MRSNHCTFGYEQNLGSTCFYHQPTISFEVHILQDNNVYNVRNPPSPTNMTDFTKPLGHKIIPKASNNDWLVEVHADSIGPQKNLLHLGCYNAPLEDNLTSKVINRSKLVS